MREKRNLLKAISLFMLVVLLCSELATGTSLVAKAEEKEPSINQAPISTMSVYKGMDTSFLKTFAFGSASGKTVDLKYETATQLLEAADNRLREGKIVQTFGFYSANDGGGATYQLIKKKETGSLELGNGLYAKLIPDTKEINGKTWGVISVKQLGANPDDGQADNGNVNETIGLANEFTKNSNIFRSIVYVPKGEYKCDNEIFLNGQSINFVGDGEDSLFYTDNDYRKDLGYGEFFFTMWGATDLYMANFKVEAREVNGYKYMRQMVFVDCNNVYTYNVDLNIPQEAFSKDFFVDKQYTSLSYYSGNKNMTLDGCKLELMCSTYRGANLGILDFYNRGEENITVMNCEMHSDARDEQVGIFNFKRQSPVQNIYFINNTMYSHTPLDKSAAGGWRTMCFTVAYNDSKNIGNIYIGGNHFISELDSKFMTFGSGLDSCIVENNMIEARCVSDLGSYVFEVGGGENNPERVKIRNNQIYLTYFEHPNTGKAAIVSGCATVENNKIVSDTYLGSVNYLNGTVKNNTLISFGNLARFTRNANEVSNNTIVSYGSSATAPDSCDLFLDERGDKKDKTLNITNNHITDYKHEDGSGNIWRSLIKLNCSFKEINVTGNTYLCPNKKLKGDQIAGILFRSTNTPKVNYKNNTIQCGQSYRSYDCKVDETCKTSSCEGNFVNLYQSGNKFSTSTLDTSKTVCSDIKITENGKATTEVFTDKSSVSLGTIVKAGLVDKDGNFTQEAVVKDKKLDWYVSLDGLASVNNGVVTRKKYGDVTVYAVSQDGGQTKYGAVQGKCVVHFVKGFAKDIQFEKPSLDMQVNKKYKVVYDVLPKESASQSVAWSSSDPSVVTVSANGTLQALKAGKANITCTTLDGTNITKTLPVTVGEATVKKINLNYVDWYDYEYERQTQKDRGVEVGKTLQLKVTSYVPDHAVNKSVGKWESTDEKVATVSSNGLVKTVGPGSCSIRAYSTDGTCYGSCSVWVQPKKIPREDIEVKYTHDAVHLRWKAQDYAHGYIIYCDKGDGKGYQKVYDTKNTGYDAWPTRVGGFVESGKTYKFKVAPQITRRDCNGYYHVYETQSDEMVVTTFTEPVVSSFRVVSSTVAVNVGETFDFWAHGDNFRQKVSARSEDPSIFTITSIGTDNAKCESRIKGVKEGLSYLTLKVNDALGYEQKFPVLVYNFQKVGENVETEGMVEAVRVKWKVDDVNRQDGFRLGYGMSRISAAVDVPMDKVVITKDDKGDTYAEYVISGLNGDKDYKVTVAPYRVIKEDTFVGTASKEKKAHTLFYQDVDTVSEGGSSVAVPTKVTGVTGTTTKDTVSLSWKPTEKADGYTVYRLDESKKTWINIAIVKSCAFVDGALNAGTRYQYKVGAYVSDAKGIYEGEQSEVAAFTTEGTPKKEEEPPIEPIDNPNDPVQITPSNPGGDIGNTGSTENGGNTEEPGNTETPNNVPFNQSKVAKVKIGKNYTNKVTLTWSKVEGADGYAIYQYIGKKWKKVKTITNPSASSATVPKLSPGTAYQFRIYAYQKDGDKTVYTKYTTVKVATVPSKVKLAKAKKGKNQVTIQWKNEKAAGYEVQYSTSKKFNKNVKKVTVAKNKTKVTLKNLGKSKTIYVRVRAYTVVNGKKYYSSYSTVTVKR